MNMMFYEILELNLRILGGGRKEVRGSRLTRLPGTARGSQLCISWKLRASS